MTQEVVEYTIEFRALKGADSIITRLSDKSEVSKDVLEVYGGIHLSMSINEGDEILLLPVESSNISHVGWVSACNGMPSQMIVVFKNSGVYGYQKVALDEFLVFMNSDSKGKYLNSEIKNSYEFLCYL
jgi:hypothetical protein